MAKIKICGLTRKEDIAAVNRCLPDYIGFVFAHGSRRRVTPGQAQQLKQELDPRLRAVGVFTNETLPNIVRLCARGVIEMVQLHGDETEEYIRALRKETACPVIKAVRVQSAQQILRAQQSSCDLLLLDTYHEGQYGGSGSTFNHALIPPLHKPFILAGGLDEQNIEKALTNCSPFAVDVSSGAETGGTKDENKIRRLVAITRVDKVDRGTGYLST